MREYVGKDLIRISKRMARELYEYGYKVYFCPCNLNPENPCWSLGIWENKYLWGQYEDFDKLCNEYTYYNCNSETGEYISFYIKKDKSSMHFAFKNGSNPYVKMNCSVAEQLKELVKWKKGGWKITNIFESSSDSIMYFELAQ